jgi:hypothetical protein
VGGSYSVGDLDATAKDRARSDVVNDVQMRARVVRGVGGDVDESYADARAVDYSGESSGERPGCARGGGETDGPDQRGGNARLDVNSTRRDCMAVHLTRRNG